MSRDAQGAESRQELVGTFHVMAGALLRRRVRREMEKAAFGNGLQIDIREDRGLLGSVFYVTVRGNRVVEFAQAVEPVDIVNPRRQPPEQPDRAGSEHVGTEFVGPFSSYDVIVDGVRVPHLQAHVRDGGKVLMVCDRAVGIELPVALAEEVASFVSFAMRVAERGNGWPRVHNLLDVPEGHGHDA